jgi:hypothetical protein
MQIALEYDSKYVQRSETRICPNKQVTQEQQTCICCSCDLVHTLYQGVLYFISVKNSQYMSKFNFTTPLKKKERPSLCRNHKVQLCYDQISYTEFQSNLTT